jgi:hypothetical protein
MLLFIIILIAYISICALCVICRKLVRLSPVWHNVNMILFFSLTFHYLGIITISILLLYVLAGVLLFILQSLITLVYLATKSSDYSDILDNDNFSCGFKKYSIFLQNREEEGQNEFVRLNKSFLYTLVAVWLIYFLSRKIFTNSFKIDDYLAFIVNNMSNKRIPGLKNIKAV